MGNRLTLEQRLQALEKATACEEMRLLCRMPDGSEKVLTMEEYKDANGVKWLCVLGGGTLDDVKYLLDEIKQYAHDNNNDII